MFGEGVVEWFFFFFDLSFLLERENSFRCCKRWKNCSTDHHISRKGFDFFFLFLFTIFFSFFFFHFSFFRFFLNLVHFFLFVFSFFVCIGQKYQTSGSKKKWKLNTLSWLREKENISISFFISVFHLFVIFCVVNNTQHTRNWHSFHSLSFLWSCLKTLFLRETFNCFFIVDPQMKTTIKSFSLSFSSLFFIQKKNSWLPKFKGNFIFRQSDLNSNLFLHPLLLLLSFLLVVLLFVLLVLFFLFLFCSFRFHSFLQFIKIQLQQKKKEKNEKKKKNIKKKKWNLQLDNQFNNILIFCNIKNCFTLLTKKESLKKKEALHTLPQITT